MSSTEEILAVNKKLLDSIAGGDWKTYAELCDPNISCFEPEAQGNVVEGLAFHKYYFDLPGDGKPRNTTVVSPLVRFCGDDVAIVAYIRLTQKLAADGSPVTAAMEETRVWQRSGGKWRHVHFHRSAAG
jgi:ketosteroid isomerase-like protein